MNDEVYSEDEFNQGPQEIEEARDSLDGIESPEPPIDFIQEARQESLEPFDDDLAPIENEDEGYEYGDEENAGYAKTISDRGVEMVDDGLFTDQAN
jgi:hypothetical protein